jgi:hypothetical protein
LFINFVLIAKVFIIIGFAHLDLLGSCIDKLQLKKTIPGSLDKQIIFLELREKELKNNTLVK